MSVSTAHSDAWGDVPAVWREVIAIESRVWASRADKDQAIEEAGLSPPRYYQILNTMLDDERALVVAPLLVRRLRRLRETLRRRRGACGAVSSPGLRPAHPAQGELPLSA